MYSRRSSPSAAGQRRPLKQIRQLLRYLTTGALATRKRVDHHKVTMLVGTGIDIVEIRRIEQSIERFGARFLDRIYTVGEIGYCLGRRQSTESFAARFAAKEAGAKALGTGIQHGISWKELEVIRPSGQRPTLRLHGRAAAMSRQLGVSHTWLALSHSRGLAMATVHMET